MDQKAEAIETVRRTFGEVFGAAPELIARAPGRVNLIGEHTDYNDGFVLPVAIDRDVRVAVRRRADRRARLYAANFGRRTDFPVDDIHRQPNERWSHYVPSGAGLSSSAAVEVATATAIKHLYALDVDPVQIALLCQKAENEFVGVNSGIMDQFISALGQQGSALFLDCRTLETRHVPLPDDVHIVVADTTVKRGLVDSEYNRRRAECEEATRILGQRLPDVRALRDVTMEQFARFASDLPEVIRRRARHVISENERVLAAVDALSRADVHRFGRLMDESHASLHDDYQVTIPQLDVIVEAAHAVPGVLGSRMTGAGFGGCTVSLVETAAVNTFRATVPERYRKETGLDPKIYVCRAVAGASIVA